ncbi:MAG: hypothetical protein EPO65_11640 [Dehalococcoidia bacterium]|nr:MAG: hypothetical protein EPO65_11640 [Dehalococcoidia bacterium]
MNDPVEQAWQVLKTRTDDLPDFWITVYQAALEAAFREGNTSAGVGLAIFAAASLESQGRPGMALAHIDDALAIFGSDAGVHARLTSFRAIFEAICGMDTASRSIAQARRGIRSLPLHVATEVDLFAAVVGAIQLRAQHRARRTKRCHR